MPPTPKEGDGTEQQRGIGSFKVRVVTVTVKG